VRRWPSLLGVLLAGSLLLRCSPGPPASEKAPARNLVIICLDTLRADRVGAYGNDRDTTPKIDRLARRGLLFERAVAHSNWTVPATASLLTGTLPSRHGAGVVGEVRNLLESVPTEIRPSVPTLAELLVEGGFRSGFFSANPYLQNSFHRGFSDAMVERTGAHDLTGRALGWLQEDFERPFFLYVQYMDLHEPIWPPKKYREMFASDPSSLPRWRHRRWFSPPDNDFEVPELDRFRDLKLTLYDSALRYVDYEIGRLVRALRQAGVLKETLIVITSDHGEEFWDHAALEAELGGDPRGKYGFGHGHSMFEELLRVPLILFGPGIPKGVRATCEVGHRDLLPTLLPLLGITPPSELKGRNLLDLGKDVLEQGCESVPLIAESTGYGPESKAVTWRQRKLITRADGIRLLYDLAGDPQEQVDQAAERPDVVAALEAILERETVPTGLEGETVPMQLDEATKEQLRALGYLD
jgi:arylsulfatase A-like enzyme